WFVQAQSTEFGNGEYGPATFAAAGERNEITIEIPDTGRIEGRLLLPPDANGEDWIVGASSGDGRACSVRASRDGRFQIEKLAPGGWVLHCLEREIAGGEFSTGAADPDDAGNDGASPYLVRPGETTRVELDVREEAELTGVLRI